MKTHIYIAVDPRKAWKGDHNYGYIITAEGREYRRSDYAVYYATYYRTCLKAITEALDRFDPNIPCEITIHCESSWIATQWRDSLEKHWQFKGYKNRRGKEIENKDLWALLYNNTYGRKNWKIKWETGLHKYSFAMREIMGRGIEMREMPV